ncbi:arsenic efflux protein [Candidatus Peregrinibacteria bacterium]|nr:arsenic efflux protein [Candidatus Peregrinibacteria bacterium]
MNIQVIIESIEHALVIAIFVFAMMVIVDYFNVLTKGKMNRTMKVGRLRQYTIASFLGSTPGCLGAFTNVSFYTHGLISFGAITGGMIATSGDEAFVMLAMFPKQAILLFILLFLLGIILAGVTDKIIKIFKIKTSENCGISTFDNKNKECKCFDISVIKNITVTRILMVLLALTSVILIVTGTIGSQSWDWKRITITILLSITCFIFATIPEHYLKDHIWKHIVKRHLLKIFLWSFFAILFVHIGLHHLDLELFVKNHMLWVLVIASLLAIIPESGPHLIFVMMFAQGLIPFSVLLTSSIIQDGHGMLPMLSYSIKDSFLIKFFNFIFGLTIGGGLYLLGF